MKLEQVHCPAGCRSQTGEAVQERYSDIEILDAGSLEDIGNSLNLRAQNQFVIPIWNSNQGEIKASEYVWNHVEGGTAKILDLWPKRIRFSFVVQKGIQTKYGRVGSVVVAKTQCSDFLKSKGFDLVDFKLSPYALDAYLGGEKFDGVLIAPGCEIDSAYEIIQEDVANDNNFTTFVRITVTSDLDTCEKPENTFLTGVTLGNLSGEALDDEQASFFENIFNTSDVYEQIPKLTFVFKRVDKIGLLFEGDYFSAADVIDAEQLESGDIYVHDNAGHLQRPYSEELEKLLTKEFSSLINHDFLIHVGEETVMFACPVMSLFTHGFEQDTVEPVVRFYIDKIFEFIDNGGKCAEEQMQFFDKYESKWRQKRADFFTFVVV